ncbi:MAG: hypothetical protein EUB_00460 [Eubacterium sp.]
MLLRKMLRDLKNNAAQFLAIISNDFFRCFYFFRDDQYWTRDEAIKPGLL